MIWWDMTKDIIQVFNHLATIAITGFGAWIAYKTLLRTPTETDRTMAGTLSADDVNGGPTAQMQELVVFETTKQRTTLKTEEPGVSCYLLNKEAASEKVQWSLGREAIKRVISEDDIRAHSGYKPRTGTFNIGRHRNWLYSKNLFTSEESLEEQLNLLLRTAVPSDRF